MTVEGTMISFAGKTVDEALHAMLDHLEAEYEAIDAYLSPEEAADLRRNYSSFQPVRLHKLPEELRLRRYRRMRRGYLRYMIEQLLAFPGEEKPTVLDAGSGWGTQGILFGLAGASVLGCDLRKDRVDIGNKRLNYWNERLGMQLDVRFACRNLFEMDADNSFDFVWSSQSISHIDPAEDFLELAFRFLKPGGQLVVSDSSVFSLFGQLRHLRARGLRVHQTYKMHTGETVPYAVERMMSYGKVSRLMKRTGFQVVHRSCFFPYFRGRASDSVFDVLLRRLDNVPLLSAAFGRLYVVAGRKPLAETCG